jgi:hypothetical protein
MAVNHALHRTRARAAWPILVRQARTNGRPLTYRNLSAQIGVHWRAAAWYLSEIQDYCRASGWPPLQALAVNAKTGVPGGGYIGSPTTEKGYAKALAAIRAKTDWPLKAPF